MRLTLRNNPEITLTAAGTAAPLWLDGGWCELAERVRRRLGPWELAWLEAILRLADHRVSEAHDIESARPTKSDGAPETHQQTEGAR